MKPVKLNRNADRASDRSDASLTVPFLIPDSPSSFHPPPCFSTRMAVSGAKVAADETNGELLPAAACEGGHGNSEGRRSTWPAASPHGRRRAQHGRRRMWTAVNPAWAAASSGIMASSPPASVNSGHGDSSGRLLGGAHVVGGWAAAPLHLPRPGCCPAPGVSRAGRRRSSGRRPWRAAPRG